MSLNFIKAWRNDKWYNERVLIWRFTLVLIKINYGKIGEYSITCPMHTSHVSVFLATYFETNGHFDSNVKLFPVIYANYWPMTDDRRQMETLTLITWLTFVFIDPYSMTVTFVFINPYSMTLTFVFIDQLEMENTSLLIFIG